MPMETDTIDLQRIKASLVFQMSQFTIKYFLTIKNRIMSHDQNQRLMDALAKCAAECSHCASACLQEQDVKMMGRCIRLDIDCAEICRLATGFVARGSEHAEQI